MFTDNQPPKFEINSVGIHNVVSEEHSQQLSPEVSKNVVNIVINGDIVVLESTKRNNSWAKFGDQSASTVAEQTAITHSKPIIDLHERMTTKYPTEESLWRSLGYIETLTQSETLMVIQSVDMCILALNIELLEEFDLKQTALNAALVSSGVKGKLNCKEEITLKDSELVNTLHLKTTRIVARAWQDHN